MAKSPDRPSVSAGTKVFLAIVVLGAVISAAFQLDYFSGFTFACSISPFVLVALFALVRLRRLPDDRLQRRGIWGQVLGAAILTTAFMVVVWTDVRWGGSSTAALVFLFVPFWGFVTLGLGALLGWLAAIIGYRWSATEPE